MREQEREIIKICSRGLGKWLCSVTGFVPIMTEWGLKVSIRLSQGKYRSVIRFLWVCMSRFIFITSGYYRNKFTKQFLWWSSGHPQYTVSQMEKNGVKNLRRDEMYIEEGKVERYELALI
jgi:hypothetical protein